MSYKYDGTVLKLRVLLTLRQLDVMLNAQVLL